MQKQLALIIIHFLIFISVFTLFKNEKIYHATLGKVSMTYERSGTWENPEIKLVKKPFIAITNENLEQWDASIYKCIEEYSYSLEGDCYNKVKFAFFPLFPLLWKTTHLSTIGVCMLNYLLFAVSILILINILTHSLPTREKIILQLICFTIPSIVIYYIPYSEAIFMMTMTLVVFGILRNKYGLYFIGCFLAATSRPATGFIVFAILLTELYLFYNYKDLRTLIKNVAMRVSPFLLGYFCVLSMEYFYTGSWDAIAEARKYWSEESLGFRLPEQISDWSVEGFGMSSFVLFFVIVPSFIFLIRLLLKPPIKNVSSGYTAEPKDYLVMVSLSYVCLFFIYFLFFRGGSMNSFTRYIINSPLFYSLLIILFEKKIKSSWGVLNNSLFFFISLILLCTFLSFVEYGGGRFRFEYAGMYIFILLAFYFSYNNYFNYYIRTLCIIGLWLLNIVWSTYLLDMFICNGWIYA
ncbi:hypothetical protein [Cytophaga aurantiaca]|uniref:hypothetical protein n=1 Tax=Cytophaga aurantiaca TaxID=29530 RepID=UPI000370F2B5|nr:hypothetical protein [Cytophaga aurantiaca]